MGKFIHISKLDAAKRQLEMAIRLFFSNSDVVSIHSLSVSAHGLLRDLSKKQKLGSLIKDEMYKMVKEEKKEKFRDMVKEAGNFFKHADKDADKLLKFYIDQTEFFLWDTCRMYQLITKESPPLIQLFNMWFYLKYPDTIADEKAQALLNRLRVDLNPENRGQFLELLPYIFRISR